MISLTDKHGLLKQFKDDQLNKTLTMFEWTNLPYTLPALELEKMLQINGYAVIAKYKDNVYAFQGGFSGQDVYNQPTQVMVNNPALKNNSTYTINHDCVVVKNDDMRQGLIKIFEYYGQRLIENQITMLMTDYNLRMPFTISSSDDQTTQSAKDYLNKIIDGSLGVIGEQKLFSALSVTPTNAKQTTTFADLFGYQQYINAQLNNNIGLATNNNMKKERLTTNEIDVNKNASYPLVDNMLKNRQLAAEKINEMFGLDVKVEYSSIWKSVNSESESDDNVDDNGNTGSDITINSDDEPATGGDEQPEKTNSENQSRPDETGTEQPQDVNEPTEKTRKDVETTKTTKVDTDEQSSDDDEQSSDDDEQSSDTDEQSSDDDKKKKKRGKK